MFVVLFPFLPGPKPSTAGKKAAAELSAAAAMMGKNRGVSRMFAATAAGRVGKSDVMSGGKKGPEPPKDWDNVLDDILAEIGADAAQQREKRRRLGESPSEANGAWLSPKVG